jgi:hypothetical protein
MGNFVRQLILLALFISGSASAATVTVTDLGDAGNGDCSSTCTLRDAITNASTGDTIDFAGTLTYPATITLSGQELLIYKDLTVGGPGAALLSINGNQASRLFEIAGNAQVTLTGLTLTGGSAVGAPGGFFGSSVAADGGPGNGGAILVNADSTLQIMACSLQGNSAIGGTGGGSFAPASHQGSGGPGNGGAVFNAGTLLIADSTLVGNSAVGGVFGIGGSPDAVPGNGGDAQGGAVFATGQTEISNSQLLQNTAQGGAGGFSFGIIPGGNGGSARGGALASAGFTAFSFVSAAGNDVISGWGGPGNPQGASGVQSGSDLFDTATLLSRYSALTSVSRTPPGNASTCATTTIVTQGANLDADSSCQNFSLHGDAKLQIVTSGNDTFAFPLWGSPLIDATADCSDAFGAAVATDVRGVVRPLDGNADGVAACDLGAVESDELFANGFD